MFEWKTKTKTIEARRIGYVVEYRVIKEMAWYPYLYAAGEDKSTAIRRWNKHNSHDREFLLYKMLYKRGLARCVPAYVEVSDEAV